jgi:UDP-2,3-diacylglucosamine pyrophosphatase LpxH
MTHYRTIFISDLHLGSKYSNALMAQKFLKQNTCDKLVLVGDIIDGWALNRKWYFPPEHLDVIRQILKSKNIIYIPGNHDEFFRTWINSGVILGNILLMNEYDHIDIHGNKWLVTHGDFFDSFMKYSWLTLLGDKAYSFLTVSNYFVNKFRNRFNMGYWSLSKWAKNKTKKALEFIYKFEDTLINYAKNRDYVGVICGHIHSPTVKHKEIKYVNTGDFCETCSAVVERFDGIFELLIMNSDGKFISEHTFSSV